jgi:hypothetical protein
MESAHNNRRIEGWVDPRTSCYPLNDKKISSLCRNSKDDSSVFPPVGCALYNLRYPGSNFKNFNNLSSYSQVVSCLVPFIIFFIDHLRTTSNTDSINVTICLHSTEFSKRHTRKPTERFTRLKIHWHCRIAIIKDWEMKVFQVIGSGRY